MDRTGAADGQGPIGPGRRRVRGYSEVSGQTGSGLERQLAEKLARVEGRLASIRAVVAIASGKGGVGKSAVTANLAVSLARRGARVGAMDADLNGPSLGRMLGLAGGHLADGEDGIVPPIGACGVRGISTELLLEEAAPLRWRGPVAGRSVWQGISEAATVREFLSDVAWGELDYLLVDLPPGTDKIGRFLDLVPNPTAVLVVTIPSEAALSVVGRSVSLLENAGVGSLGLIGNMSGYAAPGVEQPLPLFRGEGIGRLSEATGVELWVELPFDPEMGARTDRGDPIGDEGDSRFARGFRQLADRLEECVGRRPAP